LCLNGIIGCNNFNEFDIIKCNIDNFICLCLLLSLD
jgi:hypothetical protein